MSFPTTLRRLGEIGRRSGLGWPKRKLSHLNSAFTTWESEGHAAHAEACAAREQQLDHFKRKDISHPLITTRILPGVPSG